MDCRETQNSCRFHECFRALAALYGSGTVNYLRGHPQIRCRGFERFTNSEVSLRTKPLKTRHALSVIILVSYGLKLLY